MSLYFNRIKFKSHLHLWTITAVEGSWFLWLKAFKNGLSKICGRQLLKKLKWYGLPKQAIITSNFLKAVFHKFY